MESFKYYLHTIQTQDKYNHLIIVHIQYLLGTNHRLPLLHMAKSYIWLEENSESINVFSIGYMINTNLIINKVLK